MAAVDKAVVTNGAALRSKYGEEFDLAATLKPLLDADERRGLQTRVIDLSDRAHMRDLGGSAVSAPANAKQNKAAVDAVFKKLRPDYLLIVGSIDVVPHQDLRNPTPDDGDAGAPGDLPYACEAPYGRDAAAFRGPTRVVGRLPDLTGADDPEGLRSVIATAAAWKQRTRGSYEGHLGLSAEVWKKSTELSLTNTFPKPDLKLSPPSGPRWQRKVVARRMHFINCHGAEVDPQYFGERDGTYPAAHDADYVEGKITEGTVATAECCYGAELYDPADARDQAGIASTYMLEGAYGFFGSSTIAYGPAVGNGSADLICQYFLQRVLAGASIGRAALEARQRFVRETNVLDPMDLKTLAQFSLLGDPSIHPVQPTGGTIAMGGQKGVAAARAARRANLLAQGSSLEQSRSYAKARRRRRASRAVARAREEFGMPAAKTKVSSYAVEPAPALAKMRAATVPELPDAIHVLLAPIEGRLPARQFRAVVATERGGEVAWARELYSR